MGHISSAKSVFCVIFVDRCLEFYFFFNTIFLFFLGMHGLNWIVNDMVWRSVCLCVWLTFAFPLLSSFSINLLNTCFEHCILRCYYTEINNILHSVNSWPNVKVEILGRQESCLTHLSLSCTTKKKKKDRHIRRSQHVVKKHFSESCICLLIVVKFGF